MPKRKEASKEESLKEEYYSIEWIATFNYDHPQYPDKFLGKIFNLTIEEELSKPFKITGSAAFEYKQRNMIGRKVRVGLNVGKPDVDMKCWHGIVTEWKYIRCNVIEHFKHEEEMDDLLERSSRQRKKFNESGKHEEDEVKVIESKKYYAIYSFTIIPEVQFKLSTKRNRIFFPDEAQFEENQDIKFSKAKLVEYMIEKLIKHNKVNLKDIINNERTKKIKEEAHVIDKYYKSLIMDRVDRKKKKLIKDALYERLANGESPISIQMILIDTFCKMQKLDEAPKGTYLNYADKTNFSKSTDEFPEYIVQYEETDWELLNRLCRDFGIYYCFEHSDYHTGIVFFNNPQEGDDESDSTESLISFDDHQSTINQPESFKTYFGYENAIEGYRADGKVDETKKEDNEKNKTLAELFAEMNEEKKQIDTASQRSQYVQEKDIGKVFDLQDPFTDTKPLIYSPADLREHNDAYITQWHVVHKSIQGHSQLHGYNSYYDPEKRNVLQEAIEHKMENSSYLSDSDNLELAPKLDEQEDMATPDLYNEDFDSEEKMDRYTKIYEQYLKANEVEYHSRTSRQEISPGYKFVLTGHPDYKMNGQYYAKKVVHHLSYKTIDDDINPDTADLDEMELHYENESVFSRIDQPFKTLPVPQRKIMGVQTGIVVGGEGQKIYTNHLGQVKVYFHWDNARKDLSNGEMLQQAVWIRVAQWGGAGNKWGGFFVPRVGQEVIISFENGNPNCPIIIGCLHNRVTMPSYNLVESEEVISKTSIKTESLKDESGFNELSFEDKANEEKVFLHAEKDYEEIIKDSQKSTIENGSMELIIAKGDRKVELQGENDPTNGGGNDFLIIKKGDKEIKLESDEAQYFLTQIKMGDLLQEIGEGNHKLVIEKGDQKTELKNGNVIINVSDGDMEFSLNGDQKQEINGNKSITINNGNHVIKISNGNIEIEAMQMKYEAQTDLSIKSGGNLSIEAGGNLSLKGSIVEVESNTTADIKASAMINIKAGMVNLN